MPPKKKGAKKGAKDQQADDEFIENPGQAQPGEEQQQAQQEQTQVQAQHLPQAQADPAVQAQLQQNLSVQPNASAINQGSGNLQINSNGLGRKVVDTANSNHGSAHRVVNLNAPQGTESSGGLTGDLSELSLRQKKELRKQRFGTLGGDTNITTADALKKLEEEKQKRLERAQKFGIVTKDVEEQKRQERAVKFGMISASGVVNQNVSKQELDEKRKERAQRFGMVTNEDEEEKRKKRLERFGQSLEDIAGNRTIKRMKQ